MLVCTMTPGPTEPTAEQLQLHIKMLVDELLELFHNGIIVKTPGFKEGEFLGCPYKNR